jgi:hypothetical protein
MKTLRNPEDRKEIVTRVGFVRAETPRRWGKMTAHQMICHLSDSFLGVMGEKPVSIAPGWVMRSTVKWIALYTPLPWAKGMPTRPEMDQLAGGTPPGEFSADVRQLLQFTERFSNEPRDFAWQPHPFFLEMSDQDWMRWGYLHMNHHLRQFGL